MPILPVLLLLAAAVQDVPEPSAPVDERPALTQPSGPGLWIGGIAFAPEDIATVEPGLDGGEFPLPGVILTFTESGRAKFARAQQGRIGQVLEIALDGELITDPVLLEPIPGAEVMIGSGIDMDEIEKLADRLRAAAQPR